MVLMLIRTMDIEPNFHVLMSEQTAHVAKRLLFTAGERFDPRDSSA